MTVTLNQQHSTLKLIYGYESCFVKTKVGYREYESIFDVTVGDYLHKFVDRKATLHQKNDFWRHFSERIWSYDDFTFTFAPAAASLLTGALSYKIWYNPKEVYQLMLCALLVPYAPNDLDTKLLGEENRGIADMLKAAWFMEQIAYFEKHGKFRKCGKVSTHEVVSHDFWMLLKECEEHGAWTEDAWQFHTNFLVTCDYYHNNVVAIMQHEMLHIMWEHLTRMGDRDPMLHNIATDYAINQQLPFSPEIRKLLITDDNEDFFTRFVTGVAIWRASISSKDRKVLEGYGLTVKSKPEEFAKKKDELAKEFVLERLTKNAF